MYEIFVVMKEQHPAVAFYVEDKGTAFSIAKLLSFDKNIFAVTVEDENGKVLLEM